MEYKTLLYYITLSLSVILAWFLLAIPPKKGAPQINQFSINQKFNVNDAAIGPTDLWSSEKIMKTLELLKQDIENQKPKIIFFDVSMKRSLKIPGKIMYTEIVTQTPNAFDINLSQFVCTVKGVYRFTFTGLRYYFVLEAKATKVAIVKNNTVIGSTATTIDMMAPNLNMLMAGGETLTINILTDLSPNDVVFCVLIQGGLFDASNENVTHFTGELLKEIQ